MGKKIVVLCEACGESFEREIREINRNAKLGRRVFCSRTCQGKGNISNFGEKRTTEHLKKGSANDEFSAFRIFLKSAKKGCKNRSDGREVSITLQDLKDRWDLQKGICPFTGWQLKIAKNTGEQLEKTPDRASLDRIDNAIGYVKGNVQFVSLIAQYAKNGWEDKVVSEFCRAVVENF